MDRSQEYEFYANPDNQEPQGPGRKRKARFTAMVPVRLEQATIDEIRDRAGKDERSVSSWIRRAVQRELDRQAGTDPG